MVAKRKIAFHPEKGYPIEPETQPKTVRRNARERNRVRNIDVGFEKLRVTIPTAAAQKKISRVKILSSAVDYIQHLHTLLNEHDTHCRGSTMIKQEPISNLPTPPKSTNVSPQVMSQYSPFAHHPHPGYMHHQYPMHYPSPLPTPHSPISPGYMPPHHYMQHDTASIASSGYYSQPSPSASQISPSVRSNLHTPREIHCRRGYNRESLSPGSQSTYSDSSVHSVYIPAAVGPEPLSAQVTQDPTPSSTFREEDELLDSIVQWEKY